MIMTNALPGYGLSIPRRILEASVAWRKEFNNKIIQYLYFINGGVMFYGGRIVYKEDARINT